MKKRKRRSFLQLLNPKNLANEVHVYGYHFSWKAHALTLVCSLLGISAVGVLFKLKPLYFGVIIAIVCVVLPVFILNMYKRMYEQKRFADAVIYAEQVLYSFQKSGKVVSALKETEEIFEEGRMKYVIEEAIEYLETGNANSANGILRDALGIIEKAYSCVKIHIVHELLVNCEEYGGDADRSVLLVLNDIELWKRREYMLQAKKKTLHRDNIISIIVATMLCVIALYVLDSMGGLVPGGGEISIFTVEMIQISSLAFILFAIYVLAKSVKSLTGNWLRHESLYREDYMLSGYDTVMNYDEKGGKRKSLMYAAPFIAAAFIGFCMEKVALGMVCILIGVFMLLQHRVGYNLAKRDVNNELYLVLPQWLMQIALLLQNNNVQVSIMKSIQDAPPLLRRELELLRERLGEKPNELQSYTEFCKHFDVPEAQSCMKMLHAISESGTGDVTVQINNLIQRVHEMQNTAEDIRSRNDAFQMKLLFSYPVLGATVKLLIDLTIGMMYIFQLLGNIGGA